MLRAGPPNEIIVFLYMADSIQTVGVVLTTSLPFMQRQIRQTIMFEKKLLKILCYTLIGLIPSLEE